MSTQEHIYLDARTSPELVADRIAPALRMSVIRKDDGGVFLSRPAQDGDGAVGGEVYLNDAADHDAGPEDESLLDGYPMILDVWHTGRDAALQLREASMIFEELAGVVTFPLAFVRGYDFLIATFSPALGVVWLPEKTTPYAEDRAVWSPFRVVDS